MITGEALTFGTTELQKWPKNRFLPLSLDFLYKNEPLAKQMCLVHFISRDLNLFTLK